MAVQKDLGTIVERLSETPENFGQAGWPFRDEAVKLCCIQDQLPT